MKKAKLYVIASPIGNLADISQRALATLTKLDYLLCEDTRVSQKLLKYHKLQVKTVSCHSHSSDAKLTKIIADLKAGLELGLISDAGTPGISDPGPQLLARAQEELGEGLEIIPIPGPSAFLSLLSISTWPIKEFFFYGYLPHKKGRLSALKEIAESKYPVSFYESKHRILKCLNELIELEQKLNKRFDLVLGRELTKVHESIYRGSPKEIKSILEADPKQQKGEFSVLLRIIKLNREKLKEK